MKPYAKYTFEKLSECSNRYILREHIGADIYAFPAIWRQKWHPYLGERYIMFRETQGIRPGQRLRYALSLEGNLLVTGLNFSPEFPRKAWGDFGKDAILIEFSEDWNRLTLLFFEGIKADTLPLYDLWVAGILELEEIADGDVSPMPLT